MSLAIDRNRLAEALEAASSPDATVRGNGDTYLRELEKQGALTPVLVELGVDPHRSEHLQFLALALCRGILGRCSPSHFSTRVGLMLEEVEVQELIGKLTNLGLKIVDHPGPLTLPRPCALELGMIFAAVGKHTFPQSWPDLAHILVRRVVTDGPSGGPVALWCLEVLHQILKPISELQPTSVRRRGTAAVAAGMFDQLGAIWHRMHETQQGAVTMDSTLWQCARRFDSCMLLLVALMPAVPSKQIDTLGRHFMVVLCNRVQNLGRILVSESQVSSCPGFLQDFRGVWKGLVKLLRSRPRAFADGKLVACSQLAAETAALVGRARQSPSGIDVMPGEALARHALKFLSLALHKRAVEPPLVLEGPGLAEIIPEEYKTKDEETLDGGSQIDSFLTSAGLGSLVDLIASGLGLEEAAKQALLEDPEAGPPDLPLQQAAEEVLRELLHKGFEPWATQVVEHLIRLLHVGAAGSDLALRACCLRPSLFAERVVASDMFSFLSVPEANANPLRAVRVCQIVEAWAIHDAQKFPEAVLVTLRECIADPRLPMAVRLAAIEALRQVCRGLEVEILLSYRSIRERAVQAALDLFAFVEGPEPKQKALSLVVSLACDGEEVGSPSPTESALQRLLGLWRQGSSDDIVRYGVLDSLQWLIMEACPTRRPRRSLSNAVFQCALVVINDCYSLPRHHSLRDRATGLLLGLLRSAAAVPAHLNQLPGILLSIFQHSVEGSPPQSCAQAAAEWELLTEAIALALHNEDSTGNLHMQCYVAIGKIYQNTKGFRQCGEPPRNGFPLDDPLLNKLLRMLNLCVTSGKVLDLLPLLLQRLRPAEDKENSPIRSVKEECETLPAGTLVPVICAWQLHHRAHFLAHCGTGGSVLAEALLQHFETFRCTAVRAVILQTALTLLSYVEPATSPGALVWQRFFERTAEFVEKRGAFEQFFLPGQLTHSSGLARGQPQATHVQACLRRQLAPPELHGAKDQNPTDADLARWLFRHIVAVLHNARAAMLPCAEQAVHAAAPCVQRALQEVAVGG